MHTCPTVKDTDTLRREGKDEIYWASDHHTAKFGILTKLTCDDPVFFRGHQ
jgi:hypothetical protein